MQVVQDHEATREFSGLELTEVDLLKGEGREGAVVVQVRPALGKVFIKGRLLNLLIFIVIAVASESQGVGLGTRSLDICDLDGQVQEVLFGFEGPEKSVDELNLIGEECALGVLNLEDPEIVVVFIHLLKQGRVDLVLQLGDTQVFNLDGVCDSPLATDRDRRESVDFLLKLKKGTTVQGFSLEVDDEWLTVSDGEENLQIVKLDFFGIVVNVDIHLLTWLKVAFLWLDQEDLLLQNMTFKSLFLSWFSRVSPWLHLDFVVIRHFEGPLGWDSTDVFQ